MHIEGARQNAQIRCFYALLLKTRFSETKKKENKNQKKKKERVMLATPGLFYYHKGKKSC